MSHNTWKPIQLPKNKLTDQIKGRQSLPSQTISEILVTYLRCDDQQTYWVVNMSLATIGLQGTLLATQAVSESLLQQPQLIPQKLLTAKYDTLFHFFFSKNIKRIVEKDESPQFSKFRELEFWDDEREMLKRTYDTDQFYDRIGILAQISKCTSKFHIIECAISRDPFRKIMLKRTKRIRKCEKKLLEIEEQSPGNFESRYLDSADSTSVVQNISYSATCHNIFTQHEEEETKKIQLLTRQCLNGLGVLDKYKVLQQETPNQFVMDFDGIDEEDVVLKYKKLTGKESFKKKYMPTESTSPQKSSKPKAEPVKSYSKWLKTQHVQSTLSQKKAPPTSPRLYDDNKYLNRQNRDQAHMVRSTKKPGTYAQVSNRSLFNQESSWKKQIQKVSTLLQLNNNNQYAANGTTSGRLQTVNHTEFNIIRKRALELLSEQGLRSPQTLKSRGADTFTTKRLQK